MKTGDFNLPLLANRAQTVFETVDMFGHIFVLEAPINPRLFADAAIQGMARWAGIVRHKTDDQISGIGLLGWLGDDSDKGRIYDTVSGFPTGVGLTWLQWVRDQVLAKQSPAQSITLGTNTDILTPTYTGTFQYVTPRQALDFLSNWFTGEYKVLPNATLNIGKSGDPGMFVTTPAVVVMDGEGGRDLAIKGLPAQLTIERDVEDYRTKVIVHGSAAYDSSVISPATTYKDSRGHLINMTGLVEESQATAGQEATVAAGLVPLTDHVRVQVGIRTDQYNVPADVAAGDWIYVYDVPHQLYDLTQLVRYRGRLIFPVKVRCYAITWPFERGYTILYRDLNGVYTDLTPYVAWESPGTTLEVGAPVRGLTVPSSNPGVVSGLVPLSDVVLTAPANAINFNGIPQNYRHLEVELEGANDNAADNSGVYVRLGTGGGAVDAGANYDYETTQANGVTVYGGPFNGTAQAQIVAGQTPGTGRPGGAGGRMWLKIFNYIGTTFRKGAYSLWSLKTADSATGFFVGETSGEWRNTGAVTSVQILCPGGVNFVTGTRATLYGSL